MASGTTAAGTATRPGEVTTKDRIRLPLWAWAVVGGGVLVVGYRFYQARKTAGAANSATASTVPAQSPTTILGPVDNSSQYGDILAAIQNLNGGSSSPPAGGQADPFGNDPSMPKLSAIPTPGEVTAISVRPQPGDTWAKVASRFGVSVAQLKSLNSQAADRAGWGPINTASELDSSSPNRPNVLVPFLNDDLASFNAIRSAGGQSPVK